MLYSIGTATIITSVPILSTSLDIVEAEAEDLLLPKIGAVVWAVTCDRDVSPTRLWRSAPILAVQIMVMKKRSSDDTIILSCDGHMCPSPIFPESIDQTPTIMLSVYLGH
eukprot:scaffold12305_cov117-Skeletonema_marinoi.AAC.2